MREDGDGVYEAEGATDRKLRICCSSAVDTFRRLRSVYLDRQAAADRTGGSTEVFMVSVDVTIHGYM